MANPASAPPDCAVMPRRYKVDLSPRWRAAKRVFSSYLLMQFAAGEPFQAGPNWRFMDFGVHAMAGML